VARYAPLVPLVAGALLLILAEFLTVREIKAVTVVPPGGTTVTALISRTVRNSARMRSRAPATRGTRAA
jgi:hypothetical protein